MLKLLKWDFLDIYKKYGKSIIVLLIFMFITLLIPPEMLNIGEMFSITNLIALIITLGTFFITIFMLLIGFALGFSRIFEYLRKDIKYLNMNTPVAPWKIILEKLISFVVIYLSSIGLAKLFTYIYQLIKENSQIRINIGIDVWQMLASMLVLLSILMFCIFIAKSFRFTRTNVGLFSVITFILTMIVFSYFKNILYILAGADYQVVRYVSLIVDTSNLSSSLNNIIYYLAHSITVIGLFFLNVKLLKNKVEV